MYTKTKLVISFGFIVGLLFMGAALLTALSSSFLANTSALLALVGLIFVTLTVTFAMILHMKNNYTKDSSDLNAQQETVAQILLTLIDFILLAW